VNLIKPALIDDGIRSLSHDEKKELKSFYLQKSEELKVIKFVPASGAATRMFKALIDIKDKLKAGTLCVKDIRNVEKKDPDISFIHKFPDCGIYGVDWKHSTFWGGSSNYGDDYGIAW
jgi:hypothetical protein